MRRQNKAAAVSTALYMLQIGEAQELLRRLPIICVEDCGVSADFPKLIWLMCAASSASEVYQLKEADVVFVLEFIEWLCESTSVYDTIHNKIFVQGKASGGRRVLSQEVGTHMTKAHDERFRWYLGTTKLGFSTQDVFQLTMILREKQFHVLTSFWGGYLQNFKKRKAS